MKIKYLLLVIFTFFLGCLCPTGAHAVDRELLLRDNLKRAQAGDYLVTAQNKNYTLLLVRNKDSDKISIEEITVPLIRVAKEKQTWRSWVEKGAPGHTCWIMHTIDLHTGSILQTFSFTKNEWVTIPQSQNFLTTLLNLRLTPIPQNERKKIGMTTATGSADRRLLWQPTLIVEGKAVPGVSFEAWRTRWPKDSTELSGKTIEVYVPQENSQYPSYFPYWLQISGMIGKAKVRIVDSGTHLTSPAKVPNSIP